MKPTDNELGELLRETFADKENLLDATADKPIKLPNATRRRVPIVLAAASVSAVLGGAFVVAQEGRPEQVTRPRASGPAQATPGVTVTVKITKTASPHGPPDAWAAVILEMAEWERPAAGWPGLRVLDSPVEGAGSPTAKTTRGLPFTPEQRQEIERLVGVPVEWVKSRPVGANVCDQPPAARPYVTVGSITEVGAQLEIGANIWRGCLDARWLNYRLDQRDGKWTVTGTTGPQAVS